MEISVTNPFPFEAMPRVYRWIEGFKNKVNDDFGPKTLGEFMETMAAKWETHASWAVSVDGELGGLITFERLSPWVGTAHFVFKPDFQGRGVASKACRIAIAEMFEMGIGKLSFYPLGGNLAIGSLLCNLGAKREGTLTGQTLVDGKPTDILIYGLLKENFNGILNTFVDRSGIVASGVVVLGSTEDNDNAKLDHADVHANGDGSQRPATDPIQPVAERPGSGDAGDKP